MVIIPSLGWAGLLCLCPIHLSTAFLKRHRAYNNNNNTPHTSTTNLKLRNPLWLRLTAVALRSDEVGPCAESPPPTCSLTRTNQQETTRAAAANRQVSQTVRFFPHQSKSTLTHFLPHATQNKTPPTYDHKHKTTPGGNMFPGQNGAQNTSPIIRSRNRATTYDTPTQ